MTAGILLLMARTRNKSRSRNQGKHGNFNRMRARTERMNTGVRLAFCGLVLTASAAFLVSALKPYRELNVLRSNLVEVEVQEAAVIDRKDAKERELSAIEEDPAYLELIARDRLNYHKPGEHIFRIER